MDSIFSPTTPEEEPDSIFSASPPGSAVVFSDLVVPAAAADNAPSGPPAEAATWLAAEPPGPSSGVVNAGPAPAEGPSAAFTSEVAQPDGAPFETAPTSEVLTFSAPSRDAPPEGKGAAETAPPTDAFSPGFRRATPTGMRSNLFISLVLIPLISYAVLATIAIIILYSRPQPPHPLETLPDEGELKGAKRQKPTSVLHERVDPEEKLPDKLRVPLGQALQLGDLRVTPQKVELRRIKVRTPGYSPEPSLYHSLVLHFLLENTSQDVVFCPTDPSFDRRWKRLSEGRKPYTYLEVNGRRFFGGPVPWKPDKPPQARETIEGQEYVLLHPGERTTALICTDPQDQVGKALANFHGSLLWRVHLRRGLVQVGQRELPATAVVGVVFRDADVMKSGT